MEQFLMTQTGLNTIKKYHNEKDVDALDWLREHLLVSIEFKKEDSKDVETVWNKQLKAYLKESEKRI